MTSISLPIHPEGWRFAGIFAAVSIVLYFISEPLGVIGFILTAWCVYFFRDPNRIVPQDPNLVISPADGMVVGIESMVPPKSFDMGDEERVRISIFLNVFDVHVNRMPMAGTVKQVIYQPGQFLNASLDKASDQNERNTVILETTDKQIIAVTQIAGLIARRILCDCKEDDALKAGQRYGLIRFGSRMDIYLPKGAQALVCEGQRTIGGETVLADIGLSVQKARIGLLS